MKWLYPLVGISALLVTVIVTAPAAYVLQWYQTADVATDSVGGTVWNGSAERAAVNGVTLTHLHWHLQPLGLLFAHLRFRVRAQLADGTLSGIVEGNPGDGDIQARDVRIAVPFSTLTEALDLGTIPLSGQLSIAMDRIDIEHGRPIAATGTVAIGDTRWMLASPPLTLGAFTATIHSQANNTLAANLQSEKDSALTLRGKATLMRNGHWQLNAKMKSATTAQPGLENLLNALGPHAGDSWHHVTASGQWQTVGSGGHSNSS